MSSNQVIHELTPRQFLIYKNAYQILRHHSIEILQLQGENIWLHQPWIGVVLQEMKDVLKISGESRYLVKISDIVSVKYKLSQISGQCDVNRAEKVYMVWKALIVVIDLLELLYAEILYDDSLILTDIVPDVIENCEQL